MIYSVYRERVHVSTQVGGGAKEGREKVKHTSSPRLPPSLELEGGTQLQDPGDHDLR